MPCYKIGWSNQNQVPLLPDSEYCVSLYKIRGIPSHRSNNVTSHRGTVWDIASSDYHTMIVTTGADGAVLLASTQLGFFRARKAVSIGRVRVGSCADEGSHYTSTACWSWIMIRRQASIA